MSVLVVGVNHRSAPVGLLERLTISPDDLHKRVERVCLDDDVREAVVLSTCNRTEIYAVAERFHNAFTALNQFLADLGAMTVEELTAHVFAHHDAAAAAHLFDVAAGLDSAVIGETEILGQVRQAWDIAREAGTCRNRLNLLFRAAVETGKRVRTETGISRGTSSVSHAAVEMLADEVGELASKRVLVIGAGSMGEGVAIALAKAGGAEIVVTNRTGDRAAELAERVGARAVAYPNLAATIGEVDVVIAGTGAGSTILTVESVAAARAASGNSRALHIVDIALPRDVDPAVAELPGVSVFDLDDLRNWADRGRQRRSAEAARVREITGEELKRYLTDATSRQVAPLLGALHSNAESTRRREIERFARRLSNLGENDRAAVEQLTKSIVAKLLHEPTVRLKLQAGTSVGDRNSAALSDLFDLGDINTE